jgi:hypothetical protein
MRYWWVWIVVNALGLCAVLWIILFNNGRA